jgi:chitinase
VDVHDTTNYLLFLQHLRTILPASAKITAAMQSEPFVDSHSNSPTDMSEFAKVLDWILIMNYDVWGCTCVSYRIW